MKVNKGVPHGSIFRTQFFEKQLGENLRNSAIQLHAVDYSLYISALCCSGSSKLFIHLGQWTVACWNTGADPILPPSVCRLCINVYCKYRCIYSCIFSRVFVAGRPFGSSKCWAGLCVHHWWHYIHQAAGRGLVFNEGSRGRSHSDRHGNWHRWGYSGEGVIWWHVGHLQRRWLHQAEQALILWALYPLDMLVRNCNTLHQRIRMNRIKEGPAPPVYTQTHGGTKQTSVTIVMLVWKALTQPHIMFLWAQFARAKTDHIEGQSLLLVRSIHSNSMASTWDQRHS